MPEPFSGLKNLKMACYMLADRFATSSLIDKIVAVSFDIEQSLNCRGMGDIGWRAFTMALI